MGGGPEWPRPPELARGAASRPCTTPGLERAHVVDMAEAVGVPFAEIGPATIERLTDLLDAGLVPANPLDVWGTGADTRDLFGGSLLALAADPAVQAVALAVDLVHELDGDQSYPLAMLDVAERTDKPLAVLSNLGSVIDPDVARQLRAAGVPVLEGTRSGLVALRHLLDHARRGAAAGPCANGVVMAAPFAHGASPAGGDPVDGARQARGAELLARGEATGAALLDLLAEYGIERGRGQAGRQMSPRRSPPPRRSATRSCSRPTSRRCSTSPMWAA